MNQKNFFTLPAHKVAYLLILLSFLTHLLLHEHGVLSSAINYKIKTGFSSNEAFALAKSWHGLPVEEESLNQSDDAGPVYLMAALFYLKYSTDQLRAGNYEIPYSYYIIISIVFLFFLLCLYQSTSSLVSIGFGSLLTAVFVFSSTAHYIVFSGMIYLFPALSVCVVLLWFASVKKSTTHWLFAAAAAALALYFLDFFRSFSALLLLPILLLALKPQWILANALPSARKSALALLATLALLNFFLPLPSHSQALWISTHDGLFEFGGWLNERTHSTYPSFISSSKVPPDSAYFNRWSDLFQAEEIKNIKPDYHIYDKLRPEYEKMFRGLVFGLVKDYPLEIANLELKRIWRVSVVNPWQKMGPDSDIIFQEPLDTIIRALCWLTILYALILGAWRQDLFRFLCCLLPVALPALLVHSGYIMYSMPFHFVATLLWALSVRHIYLTKVRGKLALN